MSIELAKDEKEKINAQRIVRNEKKSRPIQYSSNNYSRNQTWDYPSLINQYINVCIAFDVMLRQIFAKKIILFRQ